MENSENEHSETIQYPYLMDRVKASIFDSLVILALIWGISWIFNSMGYEESKMRIYALLLILLYEPIFVSLGGTLGHRVMKLKVKRSGHPEKNLNIFLSIVRYSVKLLLGWISLFTVSFEERKRAIHDLCSSSQVMVQKN
ncbi:MAG: RDD family protein [Flavobacteriales bacterium]|nr:RDD family protein [Flavobacteriales bacterium]